MAGIFSGGFQGSYDGGTGMRMEEYLNTVSDQIRCTKARELVTGELRDHILDQAEAYEQEGMFEEEALERAVREMGDPVETGVSLDRIHRPQMAWGLLLLVGVLGLLAAGIHYMLGLSLPEAEQVGIGYFKNYMMELLIGYVLMLVVYRLDYSILSRFGKLIAAGFLAAVIGLTCLSGAGMMINGSGSWLQIGSFRLAVPELLFLYVPLYGAVLYQYRGEGYRVFWKAALWAAIPMGFLWTRPALSQTASLGLMLLGVLSVAVWKGWFRVNRKRTLTVLWLGALLLPVVFLALWWMSGSMASYQVERLLLFLTGDPSEYAYWQLQIRELLEGSRMIGESATIPDASLVPWGMMQSSYLRAYLIGTYGILAGAGAAGLLGFLVMKMFRISVRQKNQLGMMVGCGCGMVYLLQILLHAASNLMNFPVTTSILPFLSGGGTGQMVSGILMGLVLSVYRYKNILAEKPVKKQTRAVY